MAYVINNTRGTALTTITDGTVDNTTSLQLFGKSYSGFGEGLNENLVKLLENSASASAPTAPLEGELWFDTSTNQIKVYDGTSFKPTGGAKSQSSAPTSPSAGDLWHDTDDDQLYFYSGTAWILAGPIYTKGQTLSGWKIETINDGGGVSKVISSMYNGNTRVAILSTETFTPGASITGFATINAGITLNSGLGATFSGTTTSTTHVDVSTGNNNTSATNIAGKNFLRADQSDTIAGALTIDSDSGVIVGDNQEFSITASSGDITLAQTSEDNDLSITINDGGVTKTPIAITGATGAITLTGDVTITGDLTISGSYDKSSVDVSTYVDAFIGLNEGNNTNVDGGLIVEQNGGVEARLFFDQSEGYWSAGLSSGSYSQLIRLADATTDGNTNKEKVLKTDSNGRVTATNFARPSVETITTSNTATTDVPSTGAVVNLINSEQPKWGSSAKFVATAEPNGTNDAGSVDGDFFFVREA